MKSAIHYLAFIPIIFSLACNGPSIEETEYEGRPHFKINTSTATYYYDKAGGGLSRVMDADGVDWVHYNGDPQASAPSGASGGFRGIPNMVYRSDDGGAGHPGFDQCTSELIDKKTIRSQSKSGNWQWTWVFFDDYAQLTVEKADPDHPYWFLYEGPVAGSFDPSRKYWGTDLGGPRYEVPSLNKGESILDHWQWAYFGDVDTHRIFFVLQQEKDQLIDHFAYMGDTKEGNEAEDGMVVFGFGRDKGAKALMTETGNVFKIGFLEKGVMSKEDHQWVSLQIERIITR
ncbi:hypothetical protein [Negadavirga shengliensis]|uniref:Uncharacterized protein n=1 Tax=Negadavirga shengliensis TaxID=1389218 RepID=A0ABV9T3Y3_9BACT